jgi:hypothetical protein
MNDLEKFRAGMVNNIKKDLKTNKKVLVHMVECLYQVHESVFNSWKEYRESKLEAKHVQAIIAQEFEIRDMERAKGNAKAIARPKIVTSAVNTLDSMRATRNKIMKTIIDGQRKTIEILATYGLTGDNAIKIMLESGEDLTEQFKTFRKTIMKLGKIVQEEVKSGDERQAVFRRMSHEVKEIDNQGDIIDAETV